MNELPRFTWSDAWLLLAVAIGGGRAGGAELKDVVGAGDMINHAMLTAAELRRGFAKLVAAGLVEDRAERFFLTGEAVVVCEKALKRRGLMKSMEYLERFLQVSGSPQVEPGFEDPEWTYPSLTDERLHRADGQYRREFSSQLKAIKAQKT